MNLKRGRDLNYDSRVLTHLKKSILMLKRGDLGSDNDNGRSRNSSSSQPKYLFWLTLALLCTFPSALSLADSSNAGPLFDEFDLTLDPGHRIEAVSPFYYKELKDSRTTWGIPPLFSWSKDPDIDAEEMDFAYPLLSYDRYGDQYRWHIGQVFSFAGGATQKETQRERFTLFPVYFQQRSSDPTQNYTAVFPFYGRLLNRLFRDEIFFIMFPIYGQTRKRDVVTDNYLFPFFHLRKGNSLSGWQLLPFYGFEHKGITTRTNSFNEVETIGGHEKRSIMWPFFIEETTGIGTDNQRWVQISLPAYCLDRSPQRDVTTVFWPLFSEIDDRQKRYKEWHAPWPIVVYARGPGKTTSRIFPFFSQARTEYLQSEFYMWPIYKYNRATVAPLDRERTRILFFLYSDIIARNTETKAYERRVDFWPFYTHRHEFNGNTRLQVLSVLEPIIPNNKSIERDYSHLWSFWRDEKNAKTGATSQSLFWNLYRRETTPTSKKCSLLFGLFQYQSQAQSKTLRLFYVPMSKAE